MKYLCKLKCACRRWGGIHLVDKCLLGILCLLMLQSAINLFVHEQTSPETNGIDVVVRTSAAGIFGYLISVNFNQHRKRKGAVNGGSAPASIRSGRGEAGGVTGQIGFQAEGGGTGDTAIPQPPSWTGEDRRSGGERCDRAQILVVATVGIVSLIILLIFRNFATPVTANAGSVTQFRDFVSGSVGFLISCSTSGVNEREG